MSKIVKISDKTPWSKKFSYSRVIRVNNHVVVAGTAPVKNGKIIYSGNPILQTKFILSKIEKAIKKVGAKRTDIVRTRIFVSDISKSEEIGKVHGEFFKGINPVTTMVEVNRFIDPKILIEIEAEAILNDRSNNFERPNL